MAISLQKPQGTDIYNIGIFNSNSTIIQNAINGLIDDVTTINNQLPNKLNYYGVSGDLDMNTLTGNSMYFVSGSLTADTPSGEDLPVGGNIVIHYQDSAVEVKTIITSDGRIYQKSTGDDDWKALMSKVEDNLDSDSSTNSLSARQGKELNDKKLNINYLTSADTIDIDSVTDSGVYVCYGVSVEGTFPIDDITDFVLESYGKLEQLMVQIMHIVTSDVQISYIRYGVISSGNLNFSDWVSLVNDGGSGVDLTDIYERLDALEEKGAITVELIQM